MARPIRRSADYYPHPADSRNTPEARALRARYGLEGYAVYTMLMELLCGADEFMYKFDELNIELLAGDFGISSERLHEITNYLQRLKLIEIDGETLRSPWLENTLKPVIEKRFLMQERYKQQVSAAETPVSAAETTQRKGKERKGKESNTNSFLKRDLEGAETAENLDAAHPTETALIEWAKQHTEWLKNPITEFQIKKHELDGGSISGELQKFARYYLTKAQPHVRANFEHNPTEFARVNWRGWLKNIADRRNEKAPPQPKPNAEEITFTEEQIFAMAVGIVGESIADELHGKNKLFYARKAPDKTQARERILHAAREMEKSRAGPSRTAAPQIIASFTQQSFGK